MQKNINKKNTYEMVNKWLREYHTTKNETRKLKLKTKIVTTMLPIVKKIARMIARRSYDPIDDMVQAGAIGLLKAIDGFSFEINKDFRAYAGSLIIGEIRHYIRDKMHAIRVPAYIQELSCRINSFISTLTPEELDTMTNDTVADALRLRSQDVNLIGLTERRKHVLSLDQIYIPDSSNLSYEEILTKDKYEETRDIEDSRLVIKEIISKLPDEYKTYVEMYYYQDMTKKEIADTLNMSQMQVQRKLNKAFQLLHKFVAGSYTDFLDKGA